MQTLPTANTKPKFQEGGGLLDPRAVFSVVISRDKPSSVVYFLLQRKLIFVVRVLATGTVQERF